MGVVLSTSFSVFLRNIVPFTILALMITSLPFAVSVFMSLGWLDDYSADALGELSVGVEIVGWFLDIILTAAVTYGTYQDLRGREEPLGESIRRGFPLVFPALGVAIVSTLAILLASVALIIPGLVVAVAYMVVIPVAIVERPGVFQSLDRSAELTRGNRWQVFGAFGAVWAVAIGISAFINLMMVGVAFPADPHVFGIPVGFANFVCRAVISAFSSVVIAVIYYELRVAKEGVDADEIAAVFD